MIRNEAKIDHPAVNAVRGQMEHRALWMYLLCDEAEKKGLDPAAFAPAAIRSSDITCALPMCRTAVRAMCPSIVSIAPATVSCRFRTA